MNKLEMYKRLSNEDKSNLIEYWIFDCIYDVARESDFEISDEIVDDIQELSFELHSDDIVYNLPPNTIADFITRCYIYDNSFLEKIEDIDYSDILDAINDCDYDFYKDEEM